jgi:hypothetical protein
MNDNARTSSLVKATIAALASVAAFSAPALVAPKAEAQTTFTLQNEMNNRCLEILSFRNENGAQAGMWDCWGGAPAPQRDEQQMPGDPELPQ